MSKPRVWYIQTESHTQRVFDPPDYQAMLDEFDVTVNTTGKTFTADEVAAGIAGYDAVVTGWGAPTLTDAIFAAADKLKLVAHSAGSIKALVSREMIDKYMIPRDMVLFSANVAIAYNVAESAVGMLLMTMRRWPSLNEYFHRTGKWKDPDVRWNGRFLKGSTVGVVAASSVGREVIRLLQPWPLKVIVYDPFLSDEAAAALGVEKVELNELFSRADHVTLHLPSIASTDKMIGKEQLDLMKPGATLVNTSRGSVLDHDALIEKCKKDEIYVCLDVTTPEPLPRFSEFRMLDNVYITPHVSGAGFYGYFKIGAQTLQALRDCFAGNPVAGAVDYSRYELLA
jgi:phosphoglycerate dehydrogenase-like enzyme